MMNKILYAIYGLCNKHVSALFIAPFIHCITVMALMSLYILLSLLCLYCQQLTAALDPYGATQKPGGGGEILWGTGKKDRADRRKS